MRGLTFVAALAGMVYFASTILAQPRQVPSVIEPLAVRSEASVALFTFWQKEHSRVSPPPVEKVLQSYKSAFAKGLEDRNYKPADLGTAQYPRGIGLEPGWKPVAEVCRDQGLFSDVSSRGDPLLLVVIMKVVHLPNATISTVPGYGIRVTKEPVVGGRGFLFLYSKKELIGYDVVQFYNGVVPIGRDRYTLLSPEDWGIHAANRLLERIPTLPKSGPK